MGLFSFFKARDKPRNLHSGFSFLFGNTTSGKVVNERTALQTTAVYACVRVLSEALAGLPLHVYRYNADGGKERDTAHPLYRLLHDAPNTEMTSFIWRETLMTHLLIYGNAYSQIIRDGRGQVTALYPLLPSNMDVDRVDGEIVYTYRSNKGEVKLRRSDVLHIPALGFDGLMGYSPIAMAKQTIGAAIAVEEYGAAFFKNGANPGGVLEHPSVVKDVQRVKDSWNAGFQGSANAHKISILEDGMKFHSIGIPPNEAQFLETRKYSVNEICRLFKVPPHLVGDLEKATFSNIEHQSIDFVVHSVSPWVTRWEQCLQQALILPSEQSEVFIRFNLDGLLRGDYKSRMEGYAIGRQNGWLSANDVRSLEELNRIPANEGGNLYHMNGNMIPLTGARGEKMVNKFYNFARDSDGGRELFIEGEIAESVWFGDECTPGAFRKELFSGKDDITLWINSNGGDCVAASQIYTMLMDYPGEVTVKIHGMAASAASVIAMAGTKILMSPTALMLIHNPWTVAVGDRRDMERMGKLLDEVKESILNAYEIKTGLSRTKLSNLMDNSEPMSVYTAIALGFCDGMLADEKHKNLTLSPVANKLDATTIESRLERLNLIMGGKTNV